LGHSNEGYLTVLKNKGFYQPGQKFLGKFPNCPQLEWFTSLMGGINLLGNSLEKFLGRNF
jgi:hypothetical protein